MRNALLVLAMAATAAGAQQSEPVAIRPTHVPPVLDSIPDSTTTPAPAPPPNCWRPRRNPPCPEFFLTEFGIEAPMVSSRVADRRDASGAVTGPRSDIRERLVWTFGFLKTPGDVSHGAAVSLTLELNGSQRMPFAAEYRQRRWLRSDRALDLGLGYRAAEVWDDGAGWKKAHGVTAMAGYTFNDYIGLSLRGDLLPGPGRTRSAVHAGVRSTRLSEQVLKWSAILVWRAMLAAIGLEADES